MREHVPDSARKHRPSICVLHHAAFKRLGKISFRHTPNDGVVMVIPFGDREASLPLESVKREFAISGDSPDGEMLALIAASLDFITAISPGDRLPEEVISGDASWEAAPRHKLRAATRLRLQLLAWLDPAAARNVKRQDETLPLDADPALRRLVQSAFRQAASALGLDTPEEVVAMLETFTTEFAYIEALRERLLDRVRMLAAFLEGISPSATRGDSVRRETLIQVQRLSGLALDQFRSRFDHVDAQTGEVIALLRNADSQISFIRANRDHLYRNFRAWEPVLDKWKTVQGTGGDAFWQAVADTYQFLARRYLPESEWPSSSVLHHPSRETAAQRSMVW